VHFRALHLHAFYAERFGFRRGMFPVAEMVSDRTLSLPFSAGMSDDDIAIVVASLRRALRRGP
jgi:dTDP-4-amino-4,6-dideoxygalactose transaminase